MFKSADGQYSLTKLLSFLGFTTFIIVSIAIIFIMPEKFSYEIFAVIAGAGGISSQVAGKFIANKGSRE